MAEVGPYRERLDDPESVDAFWKQLHRERRWQRVLPVIIGFLALSPAVAIAVGFGMWPRSPPASYQREATIEIGKPDASWGVVFDGGARFRLPGLTQIDPRLGSRPLWASRPTSKDTPISAERIQAAVLARASELRDCYVRSEAYGSGWGGTLVASMLIRKNGAVVASVGGDREPRRTGVSACVERTLSGLRFPAPDPEYGWVHLPLRFEP